MAEKKTFTLVGINRTIDTPNNCPLCHHIVLIKDFIVMNEHSKDLQLLFECPNSDCRSYFIGYYQVTPQSVKLNYYKPINIITPNFPKIILKISPSFISIFEEAEKAKQTGLDQIADAGFRKAFEFLIKDYAKSIAEEDKHSEIESSFAGNVVDNYIPDHRIQSVAKRALWLGNDESHYLRKWSEKDITDLISLINLTIHWIEIEQISASYINDMPETKKGE